jgi:hypothetical protein
MTLESRATFVWLEVLSLSSVAPNHLCSASCSREVVLVSNFLVPCISRCRDLGSNTFKFPIMPSFGCGFPLVSQDRGKVHYVPISVSFWVLYIASQSTLTLLLNPFFILWLHSDGKSLSHSYVMPLAAVVFVDVHV